MKLREVSLDQDNYDRELIFDSFLILDATSLGKDPMPSPVEKYFFLQK